MLPTAGLARFAGIAALIVVSIGFRGAALGQPVGDSDTQSSNEGFSTAQALEAWTKWSAAMKAVLAKNAEGMEKAFGEYLDANPSALRTALLAERTVTQTGDGGAVLLFEQDVEAGSLGENGKRAGELLTTGREQKNQADDGWYFASIGRFDVADANFKALLAGNPDPVALLEFADSVKKRTEILLQLVTHPQVGESARGVLKALADGELLIKADPGRIRQHIDRLSGPPRAFENAMDRLKDSGEYAIPFLVQSLRDPAKRELTQAILRTIPQIDRAGLNPLIMALRMDDQTTKRFIVRTLGKIPYPQALPYLLKLRDDTQTPGEVRDDAQAALSELRAKGVEFDSGTSAAKMFYQLAEAYYADRGSLAADSRLDSANVWYWRNDMLENVPVPTQIFNEVMTMRCCEEALLIDSNMKDALALWLAANFRREAQLAAGQTDRTRPENYPTGAYFAQSGGAEYSLMALSRAVDDADPAVALGTIEALRKTAGPASLIGAEGGKLPLAEALSFSNRLVRIRAGLALGQANPSHQFKNYQNLAPVLSEALMLHGGSRNALVVDPDESSANSVAGVLRGDGYTVITNSGLLAGLEQVRKELPGLDVAFVASDVSDPGLEAGLKRMRDDFAYRSLPVVVIGKAADRGSVRNMVRADHRMGEIGANAEAEQIRAALARVTHAVGVEELTPDLGGALALDAAQTLRLLASTNNPVFDLSRAQPALISVIGGTKDATLRVTVAQVLGFLGTREAQEAIAKIALTAEEEEAARVAMFDALADAAKRRGNNLGEETVAALIKVVESEANMTIRTAASQALGALNLPGNKASELVRKQYGG